MRRKITAVLAALVLGFAAMFTGGTAQAAAAPVHHVAAPATLKMHYHEGTMQGGAGSSCPWAYKWYVSTTDGYGQVWWTQNPCGDHIRPRIGCTDLYEHHYIPKWGGSVKAVGLKSKTACRSWTDSIDWMQRQIEFGSTWDSWKNVWGTGPSLAVLTSAKTYPTGYITQYRDQTLRWVSHGSGHPLTVASTGWTKFDLIYLGGSPAVYEYQTSGQGQCAATFKPTDPSQKPFVYLRTGNCTGLTDEKFTVHPSEGASYLTSNYTLGDVAISSLSSGAEVFVTAPAGYFHWLVEAT